ncbi:LPS export ABC transporter periplasmic protein LptC [Denitratisoma sp. DHT3]|uniref:LPS export ABC transporter periplasmic protein LptC n=1 Tax=Denitratisoma sp. DHT3 TaxID=1981880 RepID=UPI001198B811|nr:LPS export ABC transporter periplasmic protein LptC [Denitratisoma sp. DHT3]QDX80718.1 LPS export ABC transporter periplasmic protein LptC [Denitratisoma sp. DHT3]
MRASGAALFPITLLAALAGLTLWLSNAANVDESNRRANLRHDPDFIVENFTIERFDAQGQLLQVLKAPKMSHFPDDDSTDVSQPELVQFTGTRPTRVNAQSAWLSKDGKEVRLKGGVKLVKAEGEGSPQTVLTTEALTVFPDEELARGNVPVTVRQGGSVITGDRIEYRGKENLTILTGRARGTFPRTRTQP